MALNIRNSEADRLAEELSRLTGETKTDAVIQSLRDRLEKVRRARRPRSLSEEIAEIARRCAALPVLDAGSDDEILGYDEHGLPS